MAISNSTDRFNGYVASLAFKAPVKRALPTNQASLSGPITVDGYVFQDNDRILLIGQTNQVENGIWLVNTTSDWSRAPDFDGNRDAAAGTLVVASRSVGEPVMYFLESADPVVIGTDNIVWSVYVDPVSGLIDPGTVDDATLRWDASAGAWQEQTGIRISEDGTTFSIGDVGNGITIDHQGVADDFASINVGSLDTEIRIGSGSSAMEVLRLNYSSGGIQFLEGGKPRSMVGGYGMIHMRSGTPNSPIFTDENDVSYHLNDYQVLDYGFDTGTGATDPGAGDMSFNNATPSLVTEVYISDSGDGGQDANWILDNLAVGDLLTFTAAGDPTRFLILQVNAAPTDNTGWWTIPVTPIHTGSNLTNLTTVQMSVQWLSQASLASGTTTNSMLRWSGSAWVELTGTDQVVLPLDNDAVTPTLAFGDGDTGFYELSDDTLRLSIGGVTRFQFFVNTTNPQITGTNSASFHCTNATTSRTVATVGPRRSLGTGLGSGSADEMSLIAGGVEILRIEETSTNDHIKALFPIYHLERAAAQPDIADYGQIWVKNDTPNTLWFTDDAGNDVQLGGSGTIGGSITDNQVAVGAATANSIEGQSTFTFDVSTGQMVIGDGSTLDGSLWIRDGATGLGGIVINTNNTSGYSAIQTPLLTTHDLWLVADNGGQDIVLKANEVWIAGGTPATEHVAFSDDDTDFNMVATGKADWNISGFTNILVAGTIAANTAEGPALLNETPSTVNPTVIPRRSDVDTGIGSNAADQLSIIAGSIEFVRFVESTNNSTQFLLPIYLEEQASANPDITAYGQVWCKLATPNELWFTDDAGTDFGISKEQHLHDYSIESSSYTPTGTTQTLSYPDGPAFEVDLESVTGNITITLSNAPATGNYGQIVVKVTQDSTVARTITWAGGTFEWAGGTAHPMTTTLNGWSIFTFETWDAGTTWYAAGEDYS